MENRIRLQEFLKKSGNLPTLPGIALQILAATGKESPDINEIAEIVSCDLSLSAKILKAVNSAFYGLPIEIVSVRHALSYLGLSAVKNLLLGFSVIKAFHDRKFKFFNYTQFWKESLVGAATAKLITERVNKKHGESAFLMGLLQNIGILILVETFPKAYDQVIEESLSGSWTLHEMESRLLNINHMEVGQYVASSWGLPESFSIPIGYHHKPDKISSSNPEIETITRILHLSALCLDLFGSTKINEPYAELDDSIEKYGLSNFINSNTILRETVVRVETLFPLFEIDATESDYSWLFYES